MNNQNQSWKNKLYSWGNLYFLLFAVSCALVLSFYFISPAFAHPGRTDANGGHTCRTNCEKWGLEYGEYHYHNGGAPAPSQSSESEEATPKPVSQTITYATVSEVTDGDTIKLSTGEKVRYIGIDTPETVHPSKPVQCFGKEASTKNKELVEGKQVKLEKDVSETDKYGRLLRYVYVGDVFVNDYLVRQGYAHASSYPPDVKYQTQFTEAEKEARENNRGLWAGCNEDGTQKVVQAQTQNPPASSQETQPKTEEPNNTSQQQETPKEEGTATPASNPSNEQSGSGWGWFWFILIAGIIVVYFFNKRRRKLK